MNLTNQISINILPELITKIHQFNLNNSSKGVEETQVMPDGSLSKKIVTYRNAYEGRNVSGIANFKANQEMHDNEIFRWLITSIYLSGTKVTVFQQKAKKLYKIYFNCDIKKVATINREDMFERLRDTWKHRGKIRGCLEGAKRFSEALESYGSLKEWIVSASDSNAPNDNRLKLIDNIHFIALRSKLNFLMVIGIEEVKPDIHLLRILRRWGYDIKPNDYTKDVNADENNIMKGREIFWGWRNKLNLPFSVSQIDWVLWNFAADSGFTSSAICQKKPLCSSCPIKRECPKIL